MSKAKRNMKRRPRSGLVLALLIFTILGLGLSRWFSPVLPQGASHTGQKFVLATDRLFLPVTATLRPETSALLDEIAQNFPKNPSSHIRVLSYARSGQESLNLSYRRALAVENYLQQKTTNDRYYWFASGVYSTEIQADRVEVIITQ